MSNAARAAVLHAPLRMRLWHLTFAALALAACNSGGGSGGVPPARPPIGAPAKTLSAGQLFVDDGGAVVGAPVDSLESPVTLLIDAIALPALPLPAGVEPIGGAVRIGAAVLTRPPQWTRFVVGFVRPAGEDPETLQIALVLPAESTLDGSGTDDWAVLPTNYEATQDIVYTGAAALFPEGATYALVRTSAAAPSVALHSKPVFPGGPPFANTTVTPPLTEPLVQARCSTEFALTTVTCGPAETQAIEEAFTAFYELLLHLGYPSPALFREPFVVMNENSLEEVRLGAYAVNVRPCAVVPYLGRYNFLHEPMEICLGATDAAEVDATVRHELFHAAQWGFPAIKTQTEDFEVERWGWLIESTATVAEHSDAHTLRRTPIRSWRQIDELLAYSAGHDAFRQGIQYQTQDFWVYVGARVQQGLGMFIPIFQHGATPGHVNGVFSDLSLDPDLDSLGAAYFAWTKNQAIERAVELPTSGTTGTPLQGGSCAPQYYDNAVLPVYLGGSPGGLEYDPDHAPPWISSPHEFVDGRLRLHQPYRGPLNATVRYFTLEAPRNYSVRVSVKEPANSEYPEYAYKIYDLDDSSDQCLSEPDSLPRYFDVSQDAPREIAVLVAWTNWDSGSRPTDPPLDDPDLSPKIEIELVGLYVSPEQASHTVADNLSATGRFLIANGTDLPVQYTATPSIDWLQLTDAGPGVVPAHSFVELGYQVTCSVPGTSAQGEIQLTFLSATGALLTGPEVPTGFQVEQTCVSRPQEECIFVGLGSFEYDATATLSWSAFDSIEGSNYTRSVSVQQSATWTRTQTGPSSFDYEVAGEASLDASVITINMLPSGPTTTTTTWSSPGEVSGGAVTVSVSAARRDDLGGVCAWNVAFGNPTADVERNVDGTLTTIAWGFGIAGVNDVGLSGSVSIPLECHQSNYRDNPACPSAYASGGGGLQVFRSSLGMSVTDYNVPPMEFSWSIQPREEPAPP